MYSIIYLLLIVLLDSFLYGYCYEIKRSKLILNRGIFSLGIFDKIYDWIKPVTDKLFEKVIYYRVFQKIIEIGGLVGLYFITGSYMPVIGVLIAYYFMTMDTGYYVVLNQFDVVKKNFAHLRKWYFLGGIIFHNPKVFDKTLLKMAGVLGLMILILFGTVLL